MTLSREVFSQGIELLVDRYRTTLASGLPNGWSQMAYGFLQANISDSQFRAAVSHIAMTEEFFPLVADKFLQVSMALNLKQLGGSAGPDPRNYPLSDEEVQALLERDRASLEALKAKVEAGRPQQPTKADQRKEAISRAQEGRERAARFATYLSLGADIPSLEEAILVGKTQAKK